MPSRLRSAECRLTWKPCAKLTISSSLAAPTREHALEVELPFLQTVLPSFQVVPLVVGDVAPQDVALVLARLWGGPETLIVVSSDLSHYHNYETARPGFSDRCCDRARRLVHPGSGTSLRLPRHGRIACGSPTSRLRGPAARTVQFRRHGRLPRAGRRIWSMGVWGEAPSGAGSEFFGALQQEGAQ
jgi:hypothetical protein